MHKKRRRRTEEQERKARVNITTPQGNKKKSENEVENLEQEKKGVRKKQHKVGKSVIIGMHQ